MKRSPTYQSGFTLLETVVALALFLIMIAGFSQAVASQVTHGKRNELRSKAVMAAQYFLDDLRSQDPATLPTSGTGTPAYMIIEGGYFTVTPTYCANSTFCSSSNIRHITAEVEYLGETLYTVETVFTRLR